ARPRFTLLLPVLIEASQNRITHFTTARSWSPAADAFACTTRRSTSACPSPATPSASKKSTMASGWLVLWITISAILIWRKKPCSPCRTPSGQKCNLCLRNVLLPMSPERTGKDWSGREDLNLRPPGPEFGGAELILLVFNHLSGVSTVS